MPFTFYLDSLMMTTIVIFIYTRRIEPTYVIHVICIPSGLKYRFSTPCIVQPARRMIAVMEGQDVVPEATYEDAPFLVEWVPMSEGTSPRAFSSGVTLSA